MSTRHLAEAGFLLLMLAAAGQQLRATRRARSNPGIASGRPIRVGEALTSTMTSRLGQILVMTWWWWIGWHFLAR